MSGTLYVVATPIGNLEDVTLRALRILRDVAVIAAEDTRRTAKLLQHYSISTSATSLHEHNEHAKVPQLIERLRRGDSIALVSDAGTPLISDPGGRLVAAAHDAGIQVVPIPGPNAAIALLSAAGMPPQGFTFVGFPPPRSGERRRWLFELQNETRALVFYETPHRIRRSLAEIGEVLGDRLVAVGRELTKIHESLGIKPISQWTTGPLPEIGEFTLVVYPRNRPSNAEETQISDSELAEQFCQMANSSGLSRRETIRKVARNSGVSAKRVYGAIEELKNSVK